MKKQFRQYPIFSSLSTPIPPGVPYDGWSQPFKPYSMLEDEYTWLYKQGEKVGGVERLTGADAWGYRAFLGEGKSGFDHLGTYETLEAAKSAVENYT